ncbi:MAG: hypothetical protein R3F29_00575 [Planctomycetota bacterium]
MSDRGWGQVRRISERVFEAIDWSLLGDVYFHDDGEQHWRSRLPQVLELGVGLGERLSAFTRRGGASLWAGAGVAELPAMLGEVMVEGRDVVAANLIEVECEELNRALAEVAPDVALRYRAVDAAVAASERRFDHLGCVSLFTDPERWPMLSGVSYGRIAPVQLDVEAFVAERERAIALADALLSSLELPAVLTTTAEEVGWFLDRAALRGIEVEAQDELVETAVVGDPVGFLLLRQA